MLISIVFQRASENRHECCALALVSYEHCFCTKLTALPPAFSSKVPGFLTLVQWLQFTHANLNPAAYCKATMYCTFGWDKLVVLTSISLGFIFRYIFLLTFTPFSWKRKYSCTQIYRNWHYQQRDGDNE